MSEPSSRKLSLLLVLVFGALFGYFIYRTYFPSYSSDIYRLDFADSQTLGADVVGPRAFFRKNLYLSTKVRHAWIAVAASESFIMYLNGKAIGSQKYPAPTAQDIYDLTTSLSSGKNVLAFEVSRDTHPDPAWLRVMGAITTWDGVTYPLKSDTLTWKASSLERNILSSAKTLYWYDQTYDDVSWNRAKIYPGGDAQIRPAPLKAWPQLYATCPKANWIWGLMAEETEVRLERTLYFPFPGPAEVWLRISGLCPYKLTLNGETIRIRAEPEDVIDLINLTPLVRWGRYCFGIAAQRAPGRASVLAELVFQNTGAGPESYQTDSRWHIASGTSQEESSLPVTLAPYPSFPGFTLPQEPTAITLPWWSGSISLAIMGLTAVLVLGNYFLWSKLWRRRRQDPYLSGRLAISHLPAMLFLIVLWLISFDPRVHPDLPFQTWVAISALGLLLSGQLMAGWFSRKNQP